MPIKILAECFVAIPQLIVKFLWKFKGTTVVQTIFEKKESWRTHSISIKTCCRRTVTTAM